MANFFNQGTNQSTSNMPGASQSKPKQQAVTVRVELPDSEAVARRLATPASLRPLIKSGFAQLYGSQDSTGAEFRKLLEGYNNATSATGSVAGDHAFATKLLKDFCLSLGGSYEVLNDIAPPVLLKIVSDIRRETETSAHHRLQIAKQIAGQTVQ